ncbi:hypothetical protein KDK95_31600 [Actinospica sp. MGRD01-02]|uniref:Uncharacterized protein n=1 Tax=Actinospica acidithermotolerans TaxID=2828514 RepID=A0A941IMB1_9ACTN|nr:hypothetical protein [Actinospica acidithermotolerans]MBR7830892.1 hypothetical protein [Actinospica acidithermotolerans]
MNTANRAAGPAPVYEPRHVPQLAADLVAWLSSDQAAESEEETQFDPDGQDGPRCSTHRTAEFIRSGRLFAVSAEMTGESVRAGGQLTAYRLEERTPPYPSGLVVWHAPITNQIPVQDDVHVPVIAASWGRYSHGFEVRFWTTREHIVEALVTVNARALAPAALGRLRADARARFVAPLVPVSSTVMYLDDAPEWPCPPLTTSAPPGADVALYLVEYMSAMESCERTLMATWMRMGEEVAVQSREQADRAARKRIARLDPRLPSEVRLVTLRRVSEPPAAPVAGERRPRGPLTELQPVRGHWKNVYFPSTGTYEYREIAPYKRGPKDAPERQTAVPVGVLRR